ncbi:hypothetical protein [Mesorhizobium sanjuanii]|uniref:hypothetical protein n=1 Tax=Mesorhizobium sanjuanii TaxID=2037900 RepID=UPI00105696A7|nr:hypothetical protein [Mesorhizobium sanjuanii]
MRKLRYNALNMLIIFESRDQYGKKRIPIFGLMHRCSTDWRLPIFHNANSTAESKIPISKNMSLKLTFVAQGDAAALVVLLLSAPVVRRVGQDEASCVAALHGGRDQQPMLAVKAVRKSSFAYRQDRPR